MLPSFDISINVYLLLLIIGIAMLAGFSVRSQIIGKKNRRIAELERDMMQAYEELLDTQRDFCELQSKVKEEESPVISMKNGKKEDPPTKPVPGEGGIRKNRATGTD
jgi:hypothetical protein